MILIRCQPQMFENQGHAKKKKKKKKKKEKIRKKKSFKNITMKFFYYIIFCKGIGIYEIKYLFNL